jgi:AraC-like DNA-binding protein
VHTLFNYSGLDPDVIREQYKALIGREFYEGELDTGAEGPVELVLDKCVEFPLGIVNLRCKNNISYRRTRSHIRQDEIEVYVAWFIKRGGIKVARSTGTVVTREDGCAVYDSATPFYCELICDGRGVHESMQVIVPAHMFRARAPIMSECNASFPLTKDAGVVTAEILRVLADHGHQMSRELLMSLCDSLLTGLGDCLTVERTASPRKPLLDKRMEEIELFISRNLTNRQLSAKTVAANCDISPRYLCHILKTRGVTFSRLVWNARLEKAKEWLLAPKMQGYLVHEIATMAGYKSAAHFGRAFKSALGCTPSQYRERGLKRQAGDEGSPTDAELMH